MCMVYVIFMEATLPGHCFFLNIIGNFSALSAFSVVVFIKIYLSKLFLLVYSNLMSFLYIYSHVIHKFGNNMGIYSRVINNVGNNTGIYSLAIHNFRKNMGKYSHVIHNLRNNEIFTCYPQLKE